MWLGDHVNGGLVELRLKPIEVNYAPGHALYVPSLTTEETRHVSTSIDVILLKRNDSKAILQIEYNLEEILMQIIGIMVVPFSHE